MQNELVQSQLEIADIIVLTKSDIAPASALAAAHAVVDNMFPPKLAVFEAAMGALPVDALSISRSLAAVARQAAQPSGVADVEMNTADGAGESAASDCNGVLQGHDGRFVPMPGQPARFEGVASCGWLFHADDVFDHAALQALLARLMRCAARVKGVFRVGHRFFSVGLAQGGTCVLRPVEYRRESRLEVISAVADGATRIEGAADAQQLEGEEGELGRHVAACHWPAVEASILRCLIPS